MAIELLVFIKSRLIVSDSDFLLHVVYHTSLMLLQVTPYLDKTLMGKIYKTVVRGNIVYDHGRFSNQPKGDFVLLK